MEPDVRSSIGATAASRRCHLYSLYNTVRTRIYTWIISTSVSVHLAVVVCALGIKCRLYGVVCILALTG